MTDIKKIFVYLVIPGLVFFSCSSKEATKETFVNACINEFNSGIGEYKDMYNEEELDVLVEEYCSCSYKSIVDEGISMNEADRMSESEIMEITSSCLEEFQGKLMDAMDLGDLDLEEDEDYLDYYDQELPEDEVICDCIDQVNSLFEDIESAESTEDKKILGEEVFYLLDGECFYLNDLSGTEELPCGDSYLKLLELASDLSKYIPSEEEF